MLPLTLLPVASVENPFDGVTPSIDPLGSEFNNTALLILGVIWGLVILVAAAFVVIHGLSWNTAARVTHSPEDAAQASKKFQHSVIGLAVIVGAPIIVGGVIFLLS